MTAIITTCSFSWHSHAGTWSGTSVGGVGVAAETLQARGVAAAGRAFWEIHRGKSIGESIGSMWDICGVESVAGR